MLLDIISLRKLSSLDLPGGKTGIIPNREFMTKHYKDKGGWSEGHMLNLSIGQGEISVTPMQVIQLINLIATNGITFTPHLNLNIEDDKISKINVDYRSDVWNFIKESMYSAVNTSGGTAYNAKINKKFGTVYGKTGTLQLRALNDSVSSNQNSLFAGYIEKNGEMMSLVVVIEEVDKNSKTISKKISKNIQNFK